MAAGWQPNALCVHTNCRVCMGLLHLVLVLCTQHLLYPLCSSAPASCTIRLNICRQHLLPSLCTQHLSPAPAPSLSSLQIMADCTLDDGDVARLLIRVADLLKQIAYSDKLSLLRETALEGLRGVDRAPVADTMV